MRLLLGLGFISACLAVALGGCANGDAFPGDDCTPNDRKACSCDNGTKGWQLCLQDRSYESCGCSGNNLNEGPPPAAVCGNGRVEPGELCDDGNQRNGDDCSALCQRGSGLEGRDDCANLRPLPIDVGEQLEGRQGVSAGEGSTEGSCGGGGAAELVFAFAPRAAGTLALTVATEVRSLDATLYVREDACGAESSEPANACKNDGGEGDGEQLSLRVEEGKTYFVFVDARGGGEVTLSARLDEGAGCAGEGEACDTGIGGDCGAGKLTCFETRYLVCRADREGCG